MIALLLSSPLYILWGRQVRCTLEYLEIAGTQQFKRDKYKDSPWYILCQCQSNLDQSKTNKGISSHLCQFYSFIIMVSFWLEVKRQDYLEWRDPCLYFVEEIAIHNRILSCISMSHFLFSFVSDIPKKKESKPHKKKFSSKDKKSLKKRNKYSQPSLLLHFAILGLYALCGLLVRGNVVIISVLTVFLGIYVYWFAIWRSCHRNKTGVIFC